MSFNYGHLHTVGPLRSKRKEDGIYDTLGRGPLVKHFKLAEAIFRADEAQNWRFAAAMLNRVVNPTRRSTCCNPSVKMTWSS